MSIKPSTTTEYCHSQTQENKSDTVMHGYRDILAEIEEKLTAPRDDTDLEDNSSTSKNRSTADTRKTEAVNIDTEARCEQVAACHEIKAHENLLAQPQEKISDPLALSMLDTLARASANALRKSMLLTLDYMNDMDSTMTYILNIIHELSLSPLAKTWMITEDVTNSSALPISKHTEVQKDHYLNDVSEPLASLSTQTEDISQLLNNNHILLIAASLKIQKNRDTSHILNIIQTRLPLLSARIEEIIQALGKNNANNAVSEIKAQEKNDTYQNLKNIQKRLDLLSEKTEEIIQALGRSNAEIAVSKIKEQEENDTYQNLKNIQERLFALSDNVMQNKQKKNSAGIAISEVKEQEKNDTYQNLKNIQKRLCALSDGADKQEKSSADIAISEVKAQEKNDTYQNLKNIQKRLCALSDGTDKQEKSSADIAISEVKAQEKNDTYQNLKNIQKRLCALSDGTDKQEKSSADIAISEVKEQEKNDTYQNLKNIQKRLCALSDGTDKQEKSSADIAISEVKAQEKNDTYQNLKTDTDITSPRPLEALISVSLNKIDHLQNAIQVQDHDIASLQTLLQSLSQKIDTLTTQNTNQEALDFISKKTGNITRHLEIITKHFAENKSREEISLDQMHNMGKELHKLSGQISKIAQSSQERLNHPKSIDQKLSNTITHSNTARNDTFPKTDNSDKDSKQENDSTINGTRTSARNNILISSIQKEDSQKYQASLQSSLQKNLNRILTTSFTQSDDTSIQRDPATHPANKTQQTLNSIPAAKSQNSATHVSRKNANIQSHRYDADVNLQFLTVAREAAQRTNQNSHIRWTQFWRSPSFTALFRKMQTPQPPHGTNLQQILNAKHLKQSPASEVFSTFINTVSRQNDIRQISPAIVRQFPRETESYSMQQNTAYPQKQVRNGVRIYILVLIASIILFLIALQVYSIIGETNTEIWHGKDNITIKQSTP